MTDNVPRHPSAPPRSGSWTGLDEARRRAQEKVRLALAAGQPEAGIYCATHSLPLQTPPTERLPGTSPLLGLPFETLVWKVEGGPAVVFRRMKVRVHGYDA